MAGPAGAVSIAGGGSRARLGPGGAGLRGGGGGAAAATAGAAVSTGGGGAVGGCNSAHAASMSARHDARTAGTLGPTRLPPVTFS